MRACCGEIRSRGGERGSRGDEMSSGVGNCSTQTRRAACVGPWRLRAREHPKLSRAEYLGLLDDSVDIRVEHTESAKRRLKFLDRLCWQVDKHPDSVQRSNDATEPLHDADATG
ncbi:hypothetical protein MRX96_008161 [Rhipicephalus microplus]